MSNPTRPSVPRKRIYPTHPGSHVQLLARTPLGQIQQLDDALKDLYSPNYDAIEREKKEKREKAAMEMAAREKAAMEKVAAENAGNAAKEKATSNDAMEIDRGVNGGVGSTKAKETKEERKLRVAKQNEVGMLRKVAKGVAGMSLDAPEMSKTKKKALQQEMLKLAQEKNRQKRLVDKKMTDALGGLGVEDKEK